MRRTLLYCKHMVGYAGLASRREKNDAAVTVTPTLQMSGQILRLISDAS
jgi:hypothetical protein